MSELKEKRVEKQSFGNDSKGEGEVARGLENGNELLKLASAIVFARLRRTRDAHSLAAYYRRTTTFDHLQIPRSQKEGRAWMAAGIGEDGQASSRS